MAAAESVELKRCNRVGTVCNRRCQPPKQHVQAANLAHIVQADDQCVSQHHAATRRARIQERASKNVVLFDWGAANER